MAGDFLDIATRRGFINQCTDNEGLRTHLSEKAPVVAYIGFDCTADSLHVGSLLPIMLLRWFQKCGHKPVVLMGGGTTKVGDPSGKDESRRLLDATAIARNMAGIRQVFDKFLTFGEGPTDAVMVNNADWLDGLEYIPFLRDIGRHFSVNQMLARESVRQRLDREHPLSFLEFNYMILQAYDYLELARRAGCTLQMGGSDQWGNIVSGVDLVRRLEGKTVYGLTVPLLTTASGAKMGKTAGGAVWLNADKCRPYDYWQYWRNTEDADVGRFLRLFTELPVEEIEKLEQAEGAHLNAAKKVLATEATRLCHGDNAAETAAETARQTFEAGTTADTLPTVEIPADDLDAGIEAIDLFVRAGLSKSRAEARRLIRQGGARLNDEKITDETCIVAATDLSGEHLKLSAGKKKHMRVKPS